MPKREAVIEQASDDLQEAWAYSEILLKKEYHKAAPWRYSGEIGSEDEYIFQALVIALIVSLCRVFDHKKRHFKEHNSSFNKEEKELIYKIWHYRNKYLAHSDTVPQVRSNSSYTQVVFHKPIWEEEDTKSTRKLIEKYLQLIS